MPRSVNREISFRERPSWLSLRVSPHGGAILDSPDLRPKQLLERARRLLILVHGFNVDLCMACHSYKDFKDNLVLAWRIRSLPVYWPGDAATHLARALRRPGFFTRIKSAASYLLQIGRAKRTAEIVAKLLGGSVGRRQGRRARLEVSIVAHSLGCRFALELLNRLRPLVENGGISVRLAVLMAAAVPRFKVRSDGSLRAALETPDRVLVYHSQKDDRLRAIFRAGQVLERPWPHIWRMADRQAVGSEGWKDCAHDKPRKVIEVPVENGHSDYWNDRNIAERVVDELDGSRRVDPLGRALEIRTLGAGRTIEDRIIEPRSLALRRGGDDPEDICRDCP